MKNSDLYETVYWKTNPKTGEDEAWALNVEFLYHGVQPALLSQREGFIEVPEEYPYAEILSIKENSGLDIEEAMPHWSKRDFELINEELQEYIRNPFIY